MAAALAAIAAAGLALPGAAGAVTFSGNWTLTASASADPGLVVKTSASGGGFSTGDLGVGDSYSFDLFRIWTGENSVDAGEDTVAKPIKVAFDLGGFGGTAEGSTKGLRGPFFGQPQAGELAWDGPLVLAFGKNGTGQVTLALTGGLFNPLLSGFTNNEKFGRDVTATLTYDVAPVPVPAALPLLLGGLGLVGALGARRRAASAAA